LDRAVILVGQGEILAIARDLYTRALSSAENEPFYEQLTAHLVRASRAAAVIARATRLPLVHEAATAGLLHDLGLAYQMRESPIAMRAAMKDAHDAGSRLIEHERIHLVTDHCETLKRMLLAANVSPHIATVVEYHHDPLSAPASYRTLAAIVHAGIQLARRQSGGAADEGAHVETAFPLACDAMPAVLAELRLTEAFFEAFEHHAVGSVARRSR
jgi:HD-like signal output (HDOD) protein